MVRTEIIEFLNNQETYDKVLDIINNECQKNDTHINFHPIEDFLCGGAVANTLHSLIRGGEPVINDIDLFRFEHSELPTHGRADGLGFRLYVHLFRVV